MPVVIEIAETALNTARDSRNGARTGGWAHEVTTAPVALVSGGSRGLGAELVGVPRLGHRVATLSRTKTDFIERLLRDPAQREDLLWDAVDGRDHEALRAFVTDAAARFGRIDVLVNNAAIAVEGILPTMREHDIEAAVEVNLTAAIVLSQACSRLMLRQGSGCIVNISSVNAIRGHAGVSVYSATKAALDGFDPQPRARTRPASHPRELRRSRLFRERHGQGRSPRKQKPRISRRTPLGRLADVADVVAGGSLSRLGRCVVHHRADARGRWRHNVLTTNDPAQIESIVHDSIRAILAERRRGRRASSMHDKLNAQLGLSSLDLAVLVVDLEATLGVDPFAKLVPVTSVRSVGDLVHAYQQALRARARRTMTASLRRPSGRSGVATRRGQDERWHGAMGGRVAIVGIACRFPGAADQSAFWRNLCDGVESITPLTDADLLSAGVPAGIAADPTYVKASPVLPDIEQFDAAFFEYSPREAALMDPQQRLLLEVAWEAFEDAGHVPGRGAAQAIGVFVGAGGVVSSYLLDRLRHSAELPGETGSLTHLGNDKDFLGTRISYKLNLTGPSINVQTACSTSLVAVHLACQAILSGECDMALAGAAMVRVPQRVGYLHVKGGILSPDGHCRAFDARPPARSSAAASAPCC